MTFKETCAWLQACLPQAADSVTPDVQEIRVRAGQPTVLTGLRTRIIPWSPDARQVALAVEALTGRSFYARQQEAMHGALGLAGGHRLGLCGQMGPEGFRCLSGFCLRLAAQWPGAADVFFEKVKAHPVSMLVIGPPGSGKTTFLRDVCRQWSQRGIQTALNDEIGELAALWQGMPQLDVGPMTDVVAGCSKQKGLYQIIRTLRPQAVFTDELAAEELPAVRQALLCGVKVCASAHAGNLQEAAERFESLWQQRLFEVYGMLEAGRLVALYDREGKPWD